MADGSLVLLNAVLISLLPEDRCLSSYAVQIVWKCGKSFKVAVWTLACSYLTTENSSRAHDPAAEVKKT